LKILLGSSLYPPNSLGGAERVVHALADEFTRDGHSVSVITTQPTGDAQHTIIDGVSVHFVKVRNLYRPFNNFEPGPIVKSLWRLIDSYNPLMVRILMRIIAREKPDVVNTHNITGLSVAIWTAAKRLGVPIVHTMHDQYLLCHRSTMYKRGKNCTKQCLDCVILAMPRKRLSETVDCVIGVSDFILSRHKVFHYFKASDSFVIYNKIKHQTARPRAAGTVRDRLIFGFLGQLIPTKGVHLLIAAFMKADLEAADLWIAGKGDSPYASELRHRTRHEHNIRWVGFVRPEDFFPAIDVLVVPSTWNDTAPLVVSEAMSQGVPVLGSRRGGIPELMGSGTGWMFEPDVPNSLEIALKTCSAARAHLSQMKDACLSQAGNFFSRNWTAEYLTTYQTAMARHRGDVQD
jgi:glycosyltransferase involved in cell wall biosynthesis